MRCARSHNLHAIPKRKGGGDEMLFLNTFSSVSKGGGKKEDRGEDRLTSPFPRTPLSAGVLGKKEKGEGKGKGESPALQTQSAGKRGRKNISEKEKGGKKSCSDLDCVRGKKGGKRKKGNKCRREGGGGTRTICSFSSIP